MRSSHILMPTGAHLSWGSLLTLPPKAAPARLAPGQLMAPLTLHAAAELLHWVNTHVRFFTSWGLTRPHLLLPADTHIPHPKCPIQVFNSPKQISLDTIANLFITTYVGFIMTESAWSKNVKTQKSKALEAFPLPHFSTAGWPPVPVCLGLRGFPGHRTSSTKIGTVPVKPRWLAA